MKTLFLLIFMLFIRQDEGFLQNQLKYSRVRTAKAEKEFIVKKYFSEQGIDYPSGNIFIRIFKSEALLEIWTLKKKINGYVRVKSYHICALSGKLGPKRKQGDLQIPEGIYYISDFNPVSNFYLSLKINYPNKSDRILGYKQSLGGDIYIHGDCVTIGCVPITDESIKEVYWMAVQARENGQKKIPVHIFPAKLEGEGFDKLIENYNSNKTLTDFWDNLKIIYNYFEEYKVIPEIQIDDHGNYYIEE